MQALQLRRPLQVAAGGNSRSILPTTTGLIEQLARLRLDGATAVEGRRYASVKSQGAYRLRSNKTIPKKFGAKKTGDQYVIPGNMIYKQRGTIWHPGVNTIKGRDHTIHAAIAGYVKYYRDPARHPDKQYIGVAFNREDKLPYPTHGVRRRKLSLVAVTRKAEQIATENRSASGLPLWIIRKEGVAAEADMPQGLAVPADGEVAAENEDGAVDTPAATKASKEPRPKKKRSGAAQARADAITQQIHEKRVMRDTRLLHLQKDYSYRQSNWEIGRLVGPVGTVGGTRKARSRSSKFAANRQRREKRLSVLREFGQEAKQRRVEYKTEMRKKVAKESKRASAPA